MIDKNDPLFRHATFRPISSATILFLCFAAALSAIAAASAGWVAVRTATRTLEQPLTITACAPADFVPDQSCDGDPPVDPDTLTLAAGLKIGVSGRTILDSDVDVAYAVTVEWVHVETGTAFPVIDVPITYEAHRDAIYGADGEFAWTPPPQLLELAEPGADLGRWRIVGTATPVDRARYAPYQWDSVKTFRLVAAG